MSFQRLNGSVAGKRPLLLPSISMRYPSPETAPAFLKNRYTSHCLEYTTTCGSHRLSLDGTYDLIRSLCGRSFPALPVGILPLSRTDRVLAFSAASTFFHSDE